MKINLADEEIMGTEKSFLKRRKNGLMLSDNDIVILERNGIDYLKATNIKNLIFMIEEALNEEENEELESLNTRLGEYNYYYYTDK